MSASGQQRAGWLDPGFWERLDLLEDRHRRAQLEHRNARRSLERLTPTQTEELQRAWQHYCEAIAELDDATAELEALRTCVS
jgi:hypothetical protein